MKRLNGLKEEELEQKIDIDSLKLEKEKKDHPIWELIKFAALALLIVIPIRSFVAQPFIVSGSSMVPTFENKEYIIVDQITYKFKKIERGEVVIFRFPQDPSKFFIKRIMGLPGDTLEISDSEIIITNESNPNGIILKQDFVENKSSNFLIKKIEAGEYFVMGDNRNVSSDSRSWGTVPEKLIIGRAFLRLLPLSKIGIFPGNYDY